ncbi:MAG TPA: AraC family transcriptional regulator, partial [Cellvibrio sp.]
MLKFYRNAIAMFVALIMVSGAILYLGYTKSNLTASLFPARDDNYLWASDIEPQSPVGKTQLTLRNDVGAFEYEFFLDPDKPFPYAHFTIAFI